MDGTVNDLDIGNWNRRRLLTKSGHFGMWIGVEFRFNYCAFRRRRNSGATLYLNRFDATNGFAAAHTTKSLADAHSTASRFSTAQAIHTCGQAADLIFSIKVGNAINGRLAHRSLAGAEN